MTATVMLRVTVLEVSVDPELRDRLKRHLARVRVDEVVEGALPGTAPGKDVNLLMHSPTLTFSDPDPVGSTFMMVLDCPIANPYTGPIEVLSSADGG